MKVNTSFITQWASYQLKNDLVIKLLFDKPYSSLFTIRDKNNDYYLKVNPPAYSCEPHVLNYLSTISNHILKVHSFDNHLSCFLSLEFKSVSADEYLLKNYSEKLILKIIDEFARIQQSVSLEKLKNIGIRDISTPGLVNNFLSHVEGSVFNGYVSQLYDIKHNLDSDVQLLLNNGIRDSIEHGDFHLGNILVNEKEDFIFIDLAEATIANPLFSLIAFVYSLERKLKIPRYSGLIEKVIQNYLLSYGEFLNISDEKMKQSFVLSENLFDLYYVITIIQLLRTDPSSEKWSSRVKFHIEKIINTYS